MLAADQAVLEAIREQVLSESLIELIFTRAIERLDVAARDAGPDRDATRRELTAVEGELARLTTAIAAGGDLPSVLSAVRERERRRKDLLARLETLNACERQPVANRTALGGLLRAKLVDWQGPLSQHTAQARQLLRKVVVGRLTVTPEADVRESAITGTATLEKFVSGAVLPKGMASPTGSDGEWMAIDAWMPK